MSELFLPYTRKIPVYGGNAGKAPVVQCVCAKAPFLYLFQIIFRVRQWSFRQNSNGRRHRRSTIKILASDVKLTGLTVTGFGREILSQDAGIHIRKFAHDITITGVTVTGPGFGVYAEGVSRLTVQNSVITGEKSEHVLDRGDGVYVKSTGGAVIRGNTIR